MAAKVCGARHCETALDVDMVLLFGYGLPALIGGGHDEMGRPARLPALLAGIEGYAGPDACSGEPAPLLKQLVARGRTFDDLKQTAAKVNEARAQCRQ